MFFKRRPMIFAMIILFALLFSAFHWTEFDPLAKNFEFQTVVLMQDTDDVDEERAHCTDPIKKHHAGLTRLERIHEISYAALLDWYCDGGYGIGEIKQALAFAEANDTLSVDDIFAKIADVGDWDTFKAKLKGADKDDFDDLKDIEDEGEDLSREYYCAADAEREHPALAKLAEKNALDYGTVVVWYCEGEYGVGEIKNVLKLAGYTDLTTAEILALSEEHGSWGKVKQALKELGVLDAPGKSGDALGKDKDKDKDKDDDSDKDDAEDIGFCDATKTKQHPVLAKLASSAGLDYETVLAWNCEGGYEVGTIKHALAFADSYEMPVEEVFTLYDEYGAWGAVKEALKD